MSMILTILLLLSSIFGFIRALKAQETVSIMIAIGFMISILLLYLSPQGLFYHSLALAVISAMVLTVLILISQERISLRHRLFALMVSIPYILVCLLKLLHFQGVQTFTLGLYLSLAAFAFLSIDRRVWDHYWAHLLFISLSAVSIVIQ